MLLGTLGASLLGSMLAGKGIVRAGYEIKKEKELKEQVIDQKKSSDSTSSFDKL